MNSIDILIAFRDGKISFDMAIESLELIDKITETSKESKYLDGYKDGYQACADAVLKTFNQPSVTE